MRTCDYSAVLKKAVGLLGDDVSQIASDWARKMRGFIEERLQTGWEENFWPDLMTVEQRWFRPGYLAGTVYATGDTVYDAGSDAYYQALKGFTAVSPTTDPVIATVVNDAYWVLAEPDYTASYWVSTTAYARASQVAYLGAVYQNHTATTAGILPTNTAYWGLLTPFVASVSLDAVGATAMGTVLTCWDKNPEVHRSAKELDWFLSSDGVVVRGTLRGGFVTSAWIQFRLPPPDLSGETFDAAAIYAVGDQVSFTTTADVTNFYDCLAVTAVGESPESTPAKWGLVTLPKFLERYLVQAAYADGLKADGQTDKFAVENARADELLGDQSGLLTGVSGQGQAIRVMTR